MIKRKILGIMLMSVVILMTACGNNTGNTISENMTENTIDDAGQSQIFTTVQTDSEALTSTKKITNTITTRVHSSSELPENICLGLNSGTTYTNDVYQVSLTYPVGWTLLDYFGANDYIYSDIGTKKDVESQGVYALSMAIGGELGEQSQIEFAWQIFSDGKNYQTPESILREKQQTIFNREKSGKYTNVTTERISDYEVNGMSGYKLCSSYDEDGRKVNVCSCVFTVDEEKKLYIVVNAKYYDDKNQTIVNQLLKSIKNLNITP